MSFDPATFTMRASELAVRAAGEQPVGEPWPSDEPGACSLCGKKLHKGDPFKPFKPASTFVDQAGLTADGQLSCGYCALVFGRKTPSGIPLGNVLQKQNTLILESGIYPLNKNVHVAWFLKQTPEPPFVACIRTAKSQHVAWKAPVTLSLDAMSVQIGDQNTIIRREFLFGTIIPAAERLGAALKAHTGKDREPHPFLRMNFSTPIGTAGMLHPSIPDVVKDDEDLKHDLKTVLQATIGETWAMSFLLRRNSIEPEQPEPIITKGGTK